MKLEKDGIITPIDYKNELLTLYKNNDLDIALEKAIYFLKGNSADTWLLNFAGTIQFKLSNFKNAIFYYDRILQFNEKHFDTLNNKGLCFLYHLLWSRPIAWW